MSSASYAHLPKVALHDHLDGGVRVETVIELADQIGHQLPTTDAVELADWFDQGLSGSLETYLEAFVHTVSVMQSADAIERIAYEAVIDLAADGVVYAELRAAPTLLSRGDLSREDAIEAILAGLSRGETESGTVARFIVDAMRDDTDSEHVVRALRPFIGKGVVGFDLAGPEAGFPPDNHLPACRAAREANLGLTIHAGEADGPESMWRALQRCGAHRIGHGVHIIDDCIVEDGDITTLGSVASYVRDHQVLLEVCPTSNLHTAGWKPEEHPIGALHRAGFNLSLSCDNRLMSRVSMSDEFALVVDSHGFGIEDLHRITWQAADAAFCDWDTKQRILARIDAGYASS